MRQILCKGNVRLKGVTPALAWIFYVLDGFVRKRGGDTIPDTITITAIYDGVHVANSKHYTGEAIDIRSKNFRTVADRLRFRSELESLLNTHPVAVAQGMGNCFRVLYESAGTDNEHFHVQVKRGVTFPGV